MFREKGKRGTTVPRERRYTHPWVFPPSPHTTILEGQPEWIAPLSRHVMSCHVGPCRVNAIKSIKYKGRHAGLPLQNIAK